ncbi:MAG: TonB-dependent receptor [Candidatus Aminicenantes bacterium]|nr:TonB-dependent receptor [Candidatus Aminicenantes bacterium]
MQTRKYFVLIMIILMLFFLSTSVGGAVKVTLEGKVIDADTGDPLPALVAIKEMEKACSADVQGRFRFVFEEDAVPMPCTLVVWLIGYQKKTVEAVPGKFITVKLEIEPIPSHEVQVTADSTVGSDKAKKTVTMTRMDVYTLPGTAADPVNASRLLPGVNTGPDSSGMLIRGGATDEVAYYFDGIRVEHPFLSETLHESYFSIFDNQIVDDFNVATSGFKAEYGNALSGVVDIKAKDRIYNTEGGLGLSILGLNSYVGFPLQEWGSLTVSYNRGHSYLMTELNGMTESEFSTENGFSKLNLDLGRRLRLRILGLLDNYRFSQDEGFSLKSENRIAGLTLSAMLRKNCLMDISLSRLSYRARYDMDETFSKDFSDGAYQGRICTVLDLGRHYLEFGGNFQKRNMDLDMLLNDENIESQADGFLGGIYFSDKFRLQKRIYIRLGGRVSFSNRGQKSWSLDPRASAAFFLSNQDILRFSAGSYSQFGDYFLLNEYELQPKKAFHFSLSYDRITPKYDLRLTLYDKEYRRLFLMGENSMTNEGKGYARGGEFFIKKKHQHFDLLFVYNYLHSRRKENDIPFLARSPYEITHSMTGVFSFKWDNMSLGIRYSYASGLPYTPLLGIEESGGDGSIVPLWGDPFSESYPDYHRLDLNGNKSFQFKGKLVVFYFGITNLLNRRNVLRYEYSSNYSTRQNQYSIFGRSVFIGVYVPFF